MNTNSYTVRTMLKVLSAQCSGLNLCYFNARSLKNKIDDVRFLLSGTKIDIAVVSETWLNANVPSSFISLPNFILHRNDRVDRVGGGVAIYVSDQFTSKVLRVSNQPMLEFIAVEISANTCKYVVICVYCPPLNFSPETVSELEETISDLSCHYNNIIIAGDFNVDLIRTSGRANALENSFQSLGLEIVNRLPTYCNCENPSLLDILSVSCPENVLFHNQISPPSFFDHDILFLSLRLPSIPSLSPKQISYRDYRHIDHASLIGRCIELDWYELFSSPSIADKVDIFNSTILSLFDEFVPLVRRAVHRDRLSCPWFNTEISHLISEREFLYRRYRKYRTEFYLRQYKKVRNLTSRKICEAKSKYFGIKLHPDLPPRKLWSNLRSLGLVGSDESSSPDLDVDELNRHFAQSSPPHSSPTPSIPDSTTGFSFRCISTDEVLNALLSIKSNSTGCDNIPPPFIKLILPYVIHVITHIFNHCLTTSSFPPQWKKARVIPIPKISSPSTPADYRPISILPYLSKALERIMSEQIQAHLTCNNLLHKMQSGFRKHHSCETAMLKVTSDLRAALDADQVCVLVLLDFSKAFDSVDHTITLNKLSTQFLFSSSAVRMMGSFLTGRSQKVVYGNTTSKECMIFSGVPQGSILGPLIYSLYSNDISEVIANVNFHQYADDLQLYISRPRGLLEDGVARLNEDLSNIFRWCEDNHLKLNATKSKVMILCRNNIDCSDLPEVEIMGNKLEIVNKATSLGIVMNSNLTCCDHISHLLGKVYGGLRRLRLFSSTLSLSMRMKLVKSLLLPHFLYGMQVYSALDSNCRDRLMVAFNDCIRFIFRLRRFDHVSSVRQTLLGCDLDVYLTLRSLCLLHKVHSLKTPEYLLDFIVPLRSKRCNQFLIHQHNTLLGSRSFFVRIVRTWNNLPPRITNERSTAVFRERALTYLVVNGDSL